MNLPTCDELDSIHVLVVAQPVFSTTAAVHCHPGATTSGPAHDEPQASVVPVSYVWQRRVGRGATLWFVDHGLSDG